MSGTDRQARTPSDNCCWSFCDIGPILYQDGARGHSLISTSSILRVTVGQFRIPTKYSPFPTDAIRVDGMAQSCVARRFPSQIWNSDALSNPVTFRGSKHVERDHSDTNYGGAETNLATTHLDFASLALHRRLLDQ
ncbi:hypothetical protein GCM10009543_39140 [Leifsonia naganoensis]